MNTCDSCKQSLPQNLFPKKEFAKAGAPICRQCKRNETAERCKQPTREQTKQGRHSASGARVRPNNHGYCSYIDHLFSLECFPDIVALRAFGSAKDVSESMAAIQAACAHGLIGGEGAAKNKVKCLCIGDGSTPRTAVLACFLKKWECVSIDPALKAEWAGVNPKGVRALTCYRGTLEEYLSTESEADGSGCDVLVLLCVHSHARLTGGAGVPAIMARFGDARTTLVSLPCCPRFRSQKDVGRPPDKSYDDECVFSACRRVEVWNFKFAMCSPCS